jgi:hypothetical protein
MFGADTDSDEPRAHPARERGAFQQPYRPREPHGFRLPEPTPNLFLDERLHALRNACGEGATALNSREVFGADTTLPKWSC